MWKWVALVIGVIVATIFVIRVIKVMLKTEKESKKAEESTKVESQAEYVPQDAPIEIHSSSNSIVTDMSVKPQSTTLNEMPNISNSGFSDFADDEFMDYSSHMHKSKGRRRKPIDFDLDGEMADNFEYMPSSPEFGYLGNYKQTRKKNL